VHAAQIESHATSQQTPSTQKPLAHSDAPPHAAPGAPFGTHAPALQMLPFAQSTSVMHEGTHAPFPQTSGAHGVLAPATQVPFPSHKLAEVCTPAVHDCAAHTAPAAYFAHAPFPSHVPFVPHDAAPASTHSPSGLVFAAIAPHTPSAPLPFFTAVHATHVPPHATSQQTPSAQNPDEHSCAAAQSAPGADFATHAPLEHHSPATQSASVEHEPRQAVAPQANGAHESVPPDTHLPAPSHVLALV
jgi:hypothetical protein